MAGTNLNFPYDAEIFNYDWKNTPDIVLTSMINSGAVVQDSEIAAMIANGSNFFTVPFYNVLGGVEDVYNGVDSFTGSELAGGSYSGCVYGRMASWNAKSFIKDFNSGADPMAQIVAGVANYWIKIRQERLIGMLAAVFGISGNADWALHTTNLAAEGTDTVVADANRVDETSINDAIVKANGDLAFGNYSLAIMHSVVANKLAKLQLLEFSKYTDSSGITRSLPIGTINGLTVVVNDLSPSADSGIVAGAKEYTTYILGNGSIHYASAPVDIPSEMDRDPDTNGGKDMIYTRLRETMHPFGFSFTGNVVDNVGVPDSILLATASYALKMPAKTIYMARLITNG